jgi:hypothetical protein
MGDGKLLPSNLLENPYSFLSFFVNNIIISFFLYQDPYVTPATPIL